MKPYYADDAVTVHHADALDLLRSLPDASIDAVVTDPPYGLEFMGEEWDSPWKTGDDINADAGFGEFGLADKFRRLPLPSYTGSTNPKCLNCGGTQRGRRDGTAKRSVCICPSPRFPNVRAVEMAAFQMWCETWARECLRVLKPGGHLLAFGGTRTVHRLTCALEDAGFEIRDSIGYGSGALAWCYGSGFPKSLNVSKSGDFCQRVPGVCDPAAEKAAESAAQILLADLRRCGKADAFGIEDLHGLPVDLHPDYSLSGGPQPDVFAGVCGEGGRREEARQASRERPTGDGFVRDLRHERQEVAEPSGANAGDLLLSGVRREDQDGDVTRPCLRRDGQAGAAAVRSGQPSVEGRRHVQAAEGQLPGAEVREVPAATRIDGEVGRLHHGAPLGDGALGRSDASPFGVREPHQPKPEGQPQGEPGVVSNERRPQAGRGWPICGGCGKPAIPRGLGTALKPAWEPIVVARKPLAGTVAQNVLTHGTGALNIDACRTAAGQDYRDKCASVVGLASNRNGDAYGEWAGVREDSANPAGRWPTNVVLSHASNSDGGDLCGDGCVDGCPVAEMDRQSGTTVSRAGAPRSGVAGSGWGMKATGAEYDDAGGASRFFPVFRYEAKAPTSERPRVGDVAHPTVKPLPLLRWLVRLVTPPGGVVLEPFAGSGTTAEACVLEGFRCIAVEREAAYLPLITARLTKPLQPALDIFGGAA